MGYGGLADKIGDVMDAAKWRYAPVASEALNVKAAEASVSIINTQEDTIVDDKQVGYTCGKNEEMHHYLLSWRNAILMFSSKVILRSSCYACWQISQIRPLRDVFVQSGMGCIARIKSLSELLIDQKEEINDKCHLEWVLEWKAGTDKIVYQIG